MEKKYKINQPVIVNGVINGLCFENEYGIIIGILHKYCFYDYLIKFPKMNSNRLWLGTLSDLKEGNISTELDSYYVKEGNITKLLNIYKRKKRK